MGKQVYKYKSRGIETWEWGLLGMQQWEAGRKEGRRRRMEANVITRILDSSSICRGLSSRPLESLHYCVVYVQYPLVYLSLIRILISSCCCFCYLPPHTRPLDSSFGCSIKFSSIFTFGPWKPVACRKETKVNKNKSFERVFHGRKFDCLAKCDWSFDGVKWIRKVEGVPNWETETDTEWEWIPKNWN